MKAFSIASVICLAGLNALGALAAPTAGYESTNLVTRDEGIVAEVFPAATGLLKSLSSLPISRRVLRRYLAKPDSAEDSFDKLSKRDILNTMPLVNKLLSNLIEENVDLSSLSDDEFADQIEKAVTGVKIPEHTIG